MGGKIKYAYFYYLLMEKSIFSKLPLFCKWEKDLQHQYSGQQWKAAFPTIYKATPWTALWEISQNIDQLSYLTPSTLVMFKGHTSSQCRRACCGMGTIFYILWECPQIYHFWKSIFCIISEVVGYSIPPSPTPAILNLNIEKIPHLLWKVVTHILLAARLSVTRLWKASAPQRPMM